MPKFSKGVQLRKFNSYQIPKASTAAAMGSANGVYFKWRGYWRFMAVRGFYIDANEDPEFDIDRYRGDNPIITLK